MKATHSAELKVLCAVAKLGFHLGKNMAGQKVSPEAAKMAVPMVYNLAAFSVDLTVPIKVDS